jgi:hypothetical protein
MEVSTALSSFAVAKNPPSSLRHTLNMVGESYCDNVPSQGEVYAASGVVHRLSHGTGTCTLQKLINDMHISGCYAVIGESA